VAAYSTPGDVDTSNDYVTVWVPSGGGGGVVQRQTPRHPYVGAGADCPHAGGGFRPTLLDNWAENKHHNALTPVAEMRYMVRLRNEFGMEQKAIAKALGVSAPLVSLRLGLEKLDVVTLGMVEAGVLPVKSAYMLAGIEDADKRAAALVKVAAVFDGLGDEATVKGYEGARNRDCRPGSGGGDGEGGGGAKPITPPAPAEPAHPAAPVDPNAPKPLSAGKVQTTLQNVVKFAGTPNEVRAVLRAVLGWTLGQRTAAAMVTSVAKGLGYDPKTLDFAGMGIGTGKAAPKPAPAAAQAQAQTQTQPELPLAPYTGGEGAGKGMGPRRHRRRSSNPNWWGVGAMGTPPPITKTTRNPLSMPPTPHSPSHSPSPGTAISPREG